MDHIRFEHRPYRIDSDDESEAEGIDTMAMVADYMNFTDANYPRNRKSELTTCDLIWWDTCGSIWMIHPLN